MYVYSMKKLIVVLIEKGDSTCSIGIEDVVHLVDHMKLVTTSCTWRIIYGQIKPRWIISECPKCAQMVRFWTKLLIIFILFVFKMYIVFNYSCWSCLNEHWPHMVKTILLECPTQNGHIMTNMQLWHIWQVPVINIWYFPIFLWIRELSLFCG